MFNEIDMQRLRAYQSHRKGETSDKVVKLFTKIKKQTENNRKPLVDPRLGEYDDEEQRIQQSSRDAVKSLKILPNMEKTDEGFEVV